MAIISLPPVKDKDAIAGVEPIEGAASGPIKMKEFLEEVTKAFQKSSFDTSKPSESSREKFQLSFICYCWPQKYCVSDSFFFFTLQASYAQFEVFSDLDSFEGPLKQKVTDLLQQLAETEADIKKER